MGDYCELCRDTGLAIIKENVEGKSKEAVYRCSCPKGKQHPEEIYSPKDKDHLHPVRIPRLHETKLSGRDLAAGEHDE